MARVEKKKNLNGIIEKALVNAPKIEGYTVKELADITRTPWPTTRWHLELLEARGIVQYHQVGRAKVYSLRRKRKK